MVFHSGANDPTTEGFGLSLASASVGPVTNDLGMNAWSTTVALNGLYASYHETFTSQQTAQLAGQDLALSLELRVVAVDPNAMSSVVFGSGSNEYYMFFGSKTNGDPFVKIGSQSYTLNGAGSTYNYYQLLYNVTSDTTDLYVNGVDRIPDVTHSVYSGLGVLDFGSGQQAGPAQVNWNLISLNVPEPSVSVFLVLGGGALFYLRRKYLR
jgi:hypothetical protein